MPETVPLVGKFVQIYVSKIVVYVRYVPVFGVFLCGRHIDEGLLNINTPALRPNKVLMRALPFLELPLQAHILQEVLVLAHQVHRHEHRVAPARHGRIQHVGIIGGPKVS